jgi:hypothetical protein
MKLTIALVVTPWYPIDIKPVRKGIYQCKGIDSISDLTFFKRWNGKAWGMGYFSLQACIEDKFSKGMEPTKWRGVKECYQHDLLI